MITSIRRSLKKAARKSKSWGTIVALTLRGNSIERKANFKGSKNPVLLLYGIGATRRTFSILETRLYKDGYTVFSLNLGGLFDTFNTRAIQHLAAHIDQKIERLYKKYQFKGKLSIIAHSKGGLIGHYYVKRLGGDKRVKVLITLGTPHNGNPWALLALPLSFVLKSVRQMTPMSNFIKRLKMGPFPTRVKLYSIFSQEDRVCLYPGAVLEEARNVKNIEVDGVGHSEFLIKKNIYHIVKHILINKVPRSLEDRTRQKVKEHKKNNPKSPLRLISGDKK